jgi:hypothetical protein
MGLLRRSVFLFLSFETRTLLDRWDLLVVDARILDSKNASRIHSRQRQNPNPA